MCLYLTEIRLEHNFLLTKITQRLYAEEWRNWVVSDESMG